MTELEIDSAALSDVKIMPATELDEIAQNVAMILATEKFSVPLDRTFGIDAKLVDLPISTAQAKMSAEIATAIREQEPRAKLQKVIFKGNDDGQLVMSVRITIDESKLRGGVKL